MPLHHSLPSHVAPYPGFLPLQGAGLAPLPDGSGQVAVPFQSRRCLGQALGSRWCTPHAACDRPVTVQASAAGGPDDPASPLQSRTEAGYERCPLTLRPSRVLELGAGGQEVPSETLNPEAKNK